MDTARGTAGPTDEEVAPTDEVAPVPTRDRIEPFVLAVGLSATLVAAALVAVTRKHLFARQVAPPDTPIQVV